MLSGSLSYKPILQLSSPDRRAVGFLEGHNELNAAQEFNSLRSKAKDTLRPRMDRWCDGHLGPNRWFHNFDGTELMVFKLNEHRFYGFKCGPLPISNRPFLLCVLTIHVNKREWETDEAELARVEQWRTNAGCRAAIAQFYPEYGRGICKKLSRN